MLLVEVFPDDMRLTLATSQKAANIAYQFVLIVGASATDRVAFDILI